MSSATVPRMPRTNGPSTKPVVFIATTLMLLAVAIYLPTLWHDFVDYDDNQYITENELVQKGLTWDGMIWAFTTFKASNWHPLTWLSFMADAQLWNLWAGGFHLTNVMLHALNTMLLFIVLHRMTCSATNGLWRSALVAAIFAVHPLHVESVAWVAERKDVLSTCFGLLAIWTYVDWVKSPSTARYALVLMWFVLSLLTKPMLVTLPCVLLLLDVWPLARLTRNSTVPSKGTECGATVTRFVVEKLPLFALAAASCIITVVAQGSGKAVHTLDMFPLQSRLLNAATSYGAYLLATVWPVNLAVIYPLSDKPIAWIGVVSVVVMAVITGIVMLLRRSHPHLIVGWLWFVGTLVPVIGLIQVGMQARADRYMYVPMIGLLIMAAWSVPTFQHLSRVAGRAVWSGAIGIVIVLSVLCFRQVRHWQNSETLFANTLAVTKDNFIAHNILGASLRSQGKLEDAQDHLEEALRLRPNYIAAHKNMGMLMLDRNENQAAERHFAASLKLNDDDGPTWNNLGIAVANQGRHDDAIAHYREAIERKPDLPSSYVNLGKAMLAKGNSEQAIIVFQDALKVDATLPEAHAGLGAALWNVRRVDEAINAYQASLELRPDSIETRVNLGVALGFQGRLDEAILHFETVLRQDPNHAEAKRFLEAARAQRNASQ